MIKVPGSSPFTQFAYRLLQRLLRRAGGHCGFRIHYVIAVAPGRLRLPPRPARGLRVRALEPSDLALLRRLRLATGMSYADRFRQGHRCVGAFLPPDGERLVAFVWVVRGPARLPASFGCAWQIAAAMAWLYDLYSDPGVLGAVPHLYGYLRRHPPGAGLHLLLGQTGFENQRSRHTHLSLGYQVRATLWTLQLGRWRTHLSRSPGNVRRWRRHAAGAAIPLSLFTAGEAWEPGPPPPPAPGWYLQCACGAEVALAGEPVSCPACRRVLARFQHGVAEVGEPTPYWGEVPRDCMRALLRHAASAGWRDAVRQFLPANLQDYVAASARAGFHELLPVPQGARILDVGAGWGSIAAPLARRHRVVALEGVAERARFIALRARQEGLTRLAVVCGNIHNARLASRQFQAIIANGVLEWSALLDAGAPPRSVQLQFLTRLRELLRPGGCIYLAIENRCGWAALCGDTDHSGRRFTSLLPRWLAHRVCRRRYRAEGNVGYRTYTYTYGGYHRLFAEAGLRVAACWLSPGGYNHPGKLIPLHASALRFAIARRNPSRRRRVPLQWAGHAWFLRRFASDFVFLLRPLEEGGFEPGHVQDRAHA